MTFTNCCIAVPAEQMTFIDYIAVSAFFISVITAFSTIYLRYQQNKESVNSYLSTVWHELMSICHNQPEYLDIFTTKHYEKRMSAEEMSRYDAYCYKAWAHVQEIISKKYHKNHQFKLIISLVAKYHLHWLDRNPTVFISDEFWEAIDTHREHSNWIFSYKNLPAKNGDIDWDIVAKNYHSYILSPFDPQMVKPDENNHRRNKLLNYLDEFLVPKGTIEKKNLKLIYFGCGPGDLIPFLVPFTKH